MAKELRRIIQELRRIIQELKPWARIEIKVVERAGERLEDMLHKSNPWENEDCGRKECYTCESSMKEEKIRFKNCTRRSITYRKWCETCRRENEEKIEVKDNESKRKRGEMLEKLDYVYIGESSRSANERGGEQRKDYEFMRERSHMIKHAVMVHPNSHPHEIEFRIEIIGQHKSAFERQLTEAVLIRRRQGERLMNSKQEYNRCYIPKITVKINEKEERNPDEEMERKVKETIKMMKSKWKREKDSNEKEDMGETQVKRRKVEENYHEEERKKEDDSKGAQIDSNGAQSDSNGAHIDSTGALHNYSSASKRSDIEECDSDSDGAISDLNCDKKVYFINKIKI